MIWPSGCTPKEIKVETDGQAYSFVNAYSGPSSFFVQGRWYCDRCQKLCTGCAPAGEAVKHGCGQVMRRVASLWEIEE